MNKFTALSTLKILRSTYNSYLYNENKVRIEQLYTFILLNFILIDKNIFDYYLELINSVRFSEEFKNDLIKKAKETFNNRNNNGDMYVQKSKLLSKLEEDFAFPNESLISTWLNNYYDFIYTNKGNINISSIVSELEEKFKELDKKNQYNNLLTRFLNRVYILFGINNRLRVNSVRECPRVLLKNAKNNILTPLLSKVGLSFDEDNKIVDLNNNELNKDTYYNIFSKYYKSNVNDCDYDFSDSEPSIKGMV